MANTILVSDLITRVRNRTQTEHSDFVTDDEIIDYLNDAIKAYYDFLICNYEDYYVDGYDFNTVSGTEGYPLPSDFYKLLAVDIYLDSTTIVSGKPIQWSDRNRFRNSNLYWNATTPIKYKIGGDYIAFYPTPTGVNRINLWYVPMPPVCTNARLETIDLFGPWDTFVVYDTAIQILDKEESDISVLMKQRDELKASIIMNANNRDASGPARIQDTRITRWRS